MKAAPIRCIGVIDSMGIKMASYPLKLHLTPDLISCYTISTIPLVNGIGSIPFRGLGTFKSSNNEGEAAVRMQASCSSDERTDGYV